MSKGTDRLVLGTQNRVHHFHVSLSMHLTEFLAMMMARRKEATIPGIHRASQSFERL